MTTIAPQFLPWMRTGLATAIAETAVAGLAQHDTASASVSVELVSTSDGGSVTEAVNGPPIRLLGPADVIGIDPAQILRHDPEPDATDAEPNYFATVELAAADLPWRFTPAAPDSDGRLQPWLALIVVEEREGVWLQDRGVTLRPALHVDRAEDELPDLAQCWAWAHVQAEHDLADGVAAAYAASPEVFRARLMCPRRLPPNTSWIACLVPTFEAGVRAGLGEPGGTDLGPAWTSASVNVTLPVYHFWRFQTGARGDFEALVKRLRPRELPATVGRRDLDIGTPGGGLPTAPGTLVTYTGALVSPALGGRVWPAGHRTEMKDALREKLNRSLTASSKPEPADYHALKDDPVVGPPAYAAKQAKRRRVPREGTPPIWFEELNTEPHHRVVAGLGAEVVRHDQEAMLAAAWTFASEQVDVNRMLTQARLGWELGRKLEPKFATLSDAKLMQIAGPAMARLASPSGLTMLGALAETAMPEGLTSGAFRRASRNTKALARTDAVLTAALADPVGFIESWTTVKTPSGADLQGTVFTTTTHVVAAPSGNLPSGTFPGGTTKPGGTLPADTFPTGTMTPGGTLPAGGLGTVGAGSATGRATVGAGRATGRATVGAGRATGRATVGAGRATGRAAVRSRTAARKSSGSTVPGAGFAVLDSSAAAVISPANPVGAQAIAAAQDRAANEPLAVGQTVLFEPWGGAAGTLAADVRSALDPLATITKMVQTRAINLATDRDHDVPDRIWVRPQFTTPMYERLRALSVDYLVPGLSDVPDNTLGLLRANREFLEAFLAGLNHELGREFVWREYPARPSATWCQQFFDSGQGGPKDITVIGSWKAEEGLGANAPDGTSAADLVLLIKGALPRRYPDLKVYAVEAEWVDGKRREAIGGEVRFPVFSGRLERDAYFYGFALSQRDACGSTVEPQHPGWFFVLEERPRAPRFGLDQPRKSARGEAPQRWTGLSWSHLAADDDTPLPSFVDTSKPEWLVDAGALRGNGGPDEWGEDAAAMARITLQRPVRMLTHADSMLPPPMGLPPNIDLGDILDGPFGTNRPGPDEPTLPFGLHRPAINQPASGDELTLPFGINRPGGPR